MQTITFVTDKFYFEFVINSEEDLARITKRAFKGVRFNDQSTVTTVASARKYYATLLTNWSVQAGPEVQTLRQLLPQSSGIHHITPCLLPVQFLPLHVVLHSACLSLHLCKSIWTAKQDMTATSQVYQIPIDWSCWPVSWVIPTLACTFVILATEYMDLSMSLNCSLST